MQNFRMKKTTFILMRLIIFTLIILVGLYAIGCNNQLTMNENQGNQDNHHPESDKDIRETGILTISSEGGIIGTISVSEIRDLPDFKRTMMIHSTSGDTSHSFRGARLQDVFNTVDESILETYTLVAAIGADDYLAEITMEEIQMENNVYVMYADQEEPLLTKDGRPMGMRLVILKDDFGMRFTNYLTELILVKS